MGVGGEEEMGDFLWAGAVAVLGDNSGTDGNSPAQVKATAGPEQAQVKRLNLMAETAVKMAMVTGIVVNAARMCRRGGKI